MTTKQIPNSQSQAGLPAADLVALPPGPGKSQNLKRPPGAKDFASVIDQAASNREAKPAHVRTAKSPGRGRRDDSAAETSRAQSREPAREMQSKGRSSRVDKPDIEAGVDDDDRRESFSTTATQADASSDQVHRNGESRPVLARGKSARNTGAATESEASTEESSSAPVDADAASEDAAVTAKEATPGNIVPFPGTANAVIIPFPLAQAQAAPAVVPTALPGPANPAASVVSASDKGAATLSANQTIQNAPVPAKNAESTPTQSSIDVTALGLTPVENGETVSVKPIAKEVPSLGTTNQTETSVEDQSTNVVSVAFNSAQASRLQNVGAVSAVAPQPQLPGERAEAEETARQPLDTPASASSAKIVLLRTDAAKPAPVAAADEVAPASASSPASAGISGARQEDRMESMTASKHAAAANTASTDSSFEAPAEFTTGNSGSRAGVREVSDATGSAKVAGEWQSGRTVAPSDQAAVETPRTEPSSASVTVERVSSLVLREAALVKKYSSDSMAVVLRPDAETELFVHLTQRNGQVEASVRCERGDTQHLNALWPQLQESLAQQKVRLAPLEDSAGSRGNTNFQPPAGSLMSGGGERGTREDARPSQQQSMDEWPATPAPATAAQHVRGARGTRGRRISTSRPGWETWA